MVNALFSVWIVLGVVLAIPALFRAHDGSEVDQPLPLLFITWLGLTAIGSLLFLVLSLTESILSSPILLILGILGLIVFLGARKPNEKVE